MFQFCAVYYNGCRSCGGEFVAVGADYVDSAADEYIALPVDERFFVSPRTERREEMVDGADEPVGGDMQRRDRVVYDTLVFVEKHIEPVCSIGGGSGISMSKEKGKVQYSLFFCTFATYLIQSI